MKWHIRLLGDNYDLEDLSNVCKSKELTIEKNEEGFILKSSEFNDLEDGAKVYEKATELVALVNGASVVVLGVRGAVEVSRNLIMMDDQGRKGVCHVCEPLIGEARVMGRFQTTTRKADGCPEVVYQASPIPRWVRIAKKHEKVALILKMLSENNLDWNKLNIIFEHIEGDIGSKMVDKKWVPKGNINRFTAMVQPHRHGESGLKKHKWKATKEPMEFYEARAFIGTLVSRWIDSKGVGESGSTLRKDSA